MIGVREQYLTDYNIPHAPFPSFVKGLILNAWIISSYFLIWLFFQPKERDFQGLLWQIFVVALLSTLMSMGVNLLLTWLRDELQYNLPFLYAIFFHIEFTLLMTLLISTFVIWKKLILFEQTKFTHYTWNAFEIFLGITMLAHFFRIGTIDVYFKIPIAFLIVWILIISVNVRWVPHLNFQQKVQGIFKLAFIMLALSYFVASFQFYFYEQSLISDDLIKNLFPGTLFIFVFVYAASSALFMLFSLPTSSVFEKKEQEISSFRDLSLAVRDGKKDTDVYKVLLDSSLKSIQADAGWIIDENYNVKTFYGVSKQDILIVNQDLKDANYQGSAPLKLNFQPYFRKESVNRNYRSILATPIIVDQSVSGSLILVKNLQNSIDSVMQSTVGTYVAQAGIALFNLDLLSNAVKNEVYKNSMQIAKQTQEALMPKSLEINENIEVYVTWEPAIVVGGDYYDMHRINDQEVSFIIADVSGKGPKAAFNMAQMKGIYHSLAREDGIKPDEFFTRANAALTGCIQRDTFITATYLHVNTEEKKVDYARAGHCPTLYYSVEKEEATFLDNRGLGLGIVRNNSYKKFIHNHEIQYKEGDLLVLYTDGITEARSKNKVDEYGYDMMKEILEQNHELPLKEIANKILVDIYDFMGKKAMDDDFTLLLIRL
ncbi:PP2C family protein-serine/threonine phosphatase [Flammeovirga kamogawensis]|uniref:Serine/threonine-protein phosphatase n=1 Tax=Flammeovirga kamogawensis TaxID=373891 RepID=A0ABX8GSC0_9BACT|nr:PP2C family protein-serine/threonine phosphatase [Flammeovirga kamogawensis]MBB6462922.1 serine phosphatase RsbU (regulator of sigma subunit) [Flammeovirga kamogawensis]QWG06451.1 serine/threonine-protein phosphatase [Flammeovirga kamogawensis]TRX68281.1 SpoIIE family protein phosphatase [Flammeovirga kamogawensis]